MFYPQFVKLCAEKNIKPSALARQLGFSPSAPGRWKNGAVPQADTLQRLAEFFDVSTDYLLYGGERRHNAIHDIQNSAIVQENRSSVISVENINDADIPSRKIDGIDAEMLKIFSSLDMRDKIKVLQMAYDLEKGI